MTDTATKTTESPGRRWLEVALDTELAPDSLAQIAAAATGLLAVVVDQGEAEGRAESNDALVAHLDEELAALQAQVDHRQGVIDGILELIKKSTAKLSNEIRAYVDEAFPVAEPSPTPGTELTTVTPAPDREADVEEWRAYARAVLGVDQATVVDAMNRSQIRTLLGISNGDVE